MSDINNTPGENKEESLTNTDGLEHGAASGPVSDTSKEENKSEMPAEDKNKDVFEGAARAAEQYSNGKDAVGAYIPRHEADDGKKHGNAVKIAAAVAVCAVVFVFGLLTWRVYGYDKVHKGVVVCGIDGGGLTEEQLVSAITKYGDELYDKKSIKFSINGQYVCDIDGASVEAGIDARKSAEEAYAYGRNGGFFVRAGQILKGFTAPVQIDASASVNDDRLKAISSEAAQKAAELASQNSYKIENGILYLDTKNMGLKIDTQDICGMIKERFQTADFSDLDYSSEVFEPDASEIERILNSLQSKKKNASLDLQKDPNGGVILPSADGISFDIDSARKAFEESNDRYVQIKVDYIKPDVTEEQLRQRLFADELANVATTLNANLKDRTTNVQLAAQFINGKILNSGDEFSYNKTVGPRTVERGFKNAKIFQNGDVVNGLGGGICQVSSTLYMAALQSNLTITERSNHNFAVAYTPVGQDATVSYGSKDFKFKNSSRYPIKIFAEQKGSEIRIKIMGTKTDDITVKMETTILSKVPYQKITIQDDTLASGKTVVKNDGFTGYKSKTYRVLLDGSGKEISRTLENTSNYAKLDKVVYVGTKGSSAAASGNQNITQPTAAPTTSEQIPTTQPETTAPQPTTNAGDDLIILPPTY